MTRTKQIVIGDYASWDCIVQSLQERVDQGKPLDDITFTVREKSDRSGQICLMPVFVMALTLTKRQIVARVLGTQQYITVHYGMQPPWFYLEE